MNEMNITNATYLKEFNDETKNVGILATIDGREMSVPLVQGNRHYDEIMRQVDAGTLTISEPE